MGMFDPVYVTEVLNDILGRRGLQVTLVPKAKPEPPTEEQEEKPSTPAVCDVPHAALPP